MVILAAYKGKRVRYFAALIGVVFALGLLPGRSQQPLRVGIQSPSPALAEAILAGFAGDLQVIPLGGDATGLLARGELDYLLTGQPVPGYDQWGVGRLAAAVVVSYFNPREGYSRQELMTVLTEFPEQVVISEELALAGFFWYEGINRYLPTEEVIDRVAGDDSLIGLIPLERRVPALRVLPVDGVDPRRVEAQDSSYALISPLILHRRHPTWWERAKNWIRRKDQEDILAGLLASKVNPYWNPEQNRGSFGAVGDVMLDRDVEKEGLQKGWEWIFESAAPLMNSMDLAFCNLESPIGEKGRFINMFQAPPESIAGVVSAGFDVAALANNHTLDYHHEGMFETMQILEENNIAGVGAGANIDEARKPVILEVNGITVGFIAYTEMWFVHAREPISWQATQDEPGVVPARLDYVAEDIAGLRDKVDIIIASFHWGKEYSDSPTVQQTALARAAVDAGADLVLGHHPHVLQGIEFYKHGVIAYSLGNFVFDQILPKTKESMVLEFTLSRQGVQDMTIHPAYIQGVRPMILENGRDSYLYHRIRALSLDLRDE